MKSRITSSEPSPETGSRLEDVTEEFDHRGDAVDFVPVADSFADEAAGADTQKSTRAVQLTSGISVVSGQSGRRVHA
jgi:hypothetical protein